AAARVLAAPRSSPDNAATPAAAGAPSARKEPQIVLDDPVRHFLLHVVPARHGFEALDALRITPPDVDELGRALGRMAACAPQQEQRHLELPVLVGRVHFEIAG